MKEVIKSNYNIVIDIFTKSEQVLKPKIYQFPITQDCSMKLLYANSVTLTPGTITQDITKDNITVIALSDDYVESIRSGAMEAKINSILNQRIN